MDNKKNQKIEIKLSYKEVEPSSSKVNLRLLRALTMAISKKNIVDYLKKKYENEQKPSKS